MFCLRLAFAILLLPVIPATEISVGTVIPFMLSSGLNSSKDTAGKKIEGKVMQDVPLPSGAKIKRGARISGHIIGATKPGPSGSKVVLKFDTVEVEGKDLPLSAGLLAVASMAMVSDAQTAISGNPDRDPVTQWVTRQVGGDVVYRGRGIVLSKEGVTGKWVEGTSVLIKLMPNPNAGCSGGAGYDHEQAVWIFSSAACGAYGLPGVKISDAGTGTTAGQIALESDRKVDIRGGSGWLLMVNGNGQ